MNLIIILIPTWPEGVEAGARGPGEGVRGLVRRRAGGVSAPC